MAQNLDLILLPLKRAIPNYGGTLSRARVEPLKAFYNSMTRLCDGRGFIPVLIGKMAIYRRKDLGAATMELGVALGVST